MRGTLLAAQPGKPTGPGAPAAPDVTTVREVPALAGPPPDLATATAVRAFVVDVLGATLEVLDGRRPRAQLAAAVSEPVLAQLGELLAHRTPEHDTARLHRVHVQLRPGGSAEFFGTFVRGARVRAFAGGVELRPQRRGSRDARVPRARGAAGRSLRAVPPAGALRWVVAEFAIL